MKPQLKKRIAIMRDVNHAIRNPNTFPGGYPLSIITNDGAALCPDCAKAEFHQVAHDTIHGWRTGWDAAGVDILWEGGNTCDQCGKNLDAYPSEETDEQ